MIKYLSAYISAFVVSLFLTLISTNSFANKLETCFECRTKKLTLSDISKNKLYEIVLLRNEIYARHDYSFNDKRLMDYYFRYEWYKPNPDIEVSLNTTELSNIALFKEREKAIKNNRKLLITELLKFKSALQTNDNEYIQTILTESDKELDNNKDYYNGIVYALGNTLDSLQLENIHWHKGKAQYKVTIDNGFSIIMKSIFIEDNIITIESHDPMSHTNLMKDDAFVYPSIYMSEDEYTTIFKFEFSGGKLSLNDIFIAG